MTRLLPRTIEWDGKSRETSFLLRGIDSRRSRAARHGDRRRAPASADAPAARIRAGEPARLGQAATADARVRLDRPGRRCRSRRARVLAGPASRKNAGRPEQTARLESERQTRIANAQRLAAQADEALERFPQRSLLLAVEAVNVTLRRDEPVVVDANQSLRRALAAVSGRGFGGAGLAITQVALSPDSQWMAMGSVDAVYLWKLTERLVAAPARLAGVKGTVTDVAFGRDARWLVAVTRESGPVMWNSSPAASPPPSHCHYLRAWTSWWR